MVQRRFGQRGIEQSRQLSQIGLRIFHAQLRGLPQLFRQRLQHAPLLETADRGDLILGGLDDFGGVRVVAVDDAVDPVLHFLLDFRLRNRHGGHRRAEKGQEVLDRLALLEIQDAAAVAQRILGGKAQIEEQAVGFEADLAVVCGKLEMIALFRIRDRAAA